MKRRLWLLPLLGLCTVAGRASAQGFYYPPPTSPFARPPVSPYVNLVNGNNPAIQYYGVVRPELRLFGNVNQLQYQNALLQQQVAPGALPGEVVTGVPSHFMTQGRWFMTQYTGPNLASRPGLGAAAAGRPAVATAGAGTAGTGMAGTSGTMTAGRTGSSVPTTPGGQTRSSGFMR
jgi:hypothetical protein